MWDEPSRIPGKLWELKVQNLGSNVMHQGKLTLFKIRTYGTSKDQFSVPCSSTSFYDQNSKKCYKFCPMGTFAKEKGPTEIRRAADNEGMVMDLMELGQCLPCAKTCKKCFGPGKTDCDKYILSRAKDDVKSSGIVITPGAVFEILILLIMFM
jgi:hypothetical protein